MPFLDSLDISNEALRHIGARAILDVNEDSVENHECAEAYDKIRRYELRRNVWTSTCKRAALRPISNTTLLLQPRLWNALTTYLPGSVVSDLNGMLWYSVEADNLGNDPTISNAWDQYFGPMTADVFDPTVGYYSGELVYIQVGNPGSYVVFMSLQNNNLTVPNTATPWDATTQFGLDDVVQYLGVNYRSLLAINQNITPVNGPLNWSASTTYTTGNTVTALDGYIYSSVGSGNIGHEPTTDGGVHWTNTNLPTAWSSSPAQYPAAKSWRPLFASLTNISFVSPVGAGPDYTTGVRNLFRLPAGYLRAAPQDPKAGSVSYLGAPHGLLYNDWEFDGQYIVSATATPILFRFVTDVTDVEKFDDMFANGLSWALSVDVVERVTQQEGKAQIAIAGYNKFMGEARLVNAIEQGSTEPPEDDYIAARI